MMFLKKKCFIALLIFGLIFFLMLRELKFLNLKKRFICQTKEKSRPETDRHGLVTSVHNPAQDNTI